MLYTILNTDHNNYAAFLSRITLGIVLFPHGAQKLLGWFGGYGFEGTMEYFTNTTGLPWILGFMVIIIEFFGSLLLIAGIGSRIWAALITIVMAGIIVTTFHTYFLMNWFGNQPEEGFEFFLLMIALGLSVMISGGGAWSADSMLQKKTGKGLNHAY